MKISKFTKNFWIKLSCFGMAALLWIYVASSQSTIAKFPGDLSLQAVNTPIGYVAVYDARTVSVKVMAEPSVWSKLSSDSFLATIDLAGFSEGTHELPILVTTKVPGIKIIDKTPGTVLVSLEKQITKEIDVTAKIEGSAAEGMIAGDVIFNPAKVTVSGAKSRIERIQEVSGIIRLDNESAEFKRDITVKGRNENGDEIDGLSFFPDHVTATVPIIKGANIRTVGIKAKFSGSPKVGYYISGLTVTPNVVDIMGATSQINSINNIETVPIDIVGLSDTLEKDISLIIPQGISISGSNRVHIVLSLSKYNAYKDIIITNFRPINAGENIIISYSPDSLRLTCTGPDDKINNLSPSEVNLTFDFEGKVPNANREIEFDLKPENFIVPSDISISNISSAQIIVKVK
ncbi:MAG: CdaR family protein [Patescibacteria group bacterium]